MKEIFGVCLGFGAAVALTVTVTGSFEPSKNGEQTISRAPQIEMTLITAAD